MNVLIADPFETSGIEGLKALGCVVTHEPTVGAERLPDALAASGPQVLIVRSTKVQKPAFAAAKGLRLIIRAGAGVDNIDLPAATAAKVAVCNCPGMNAVAVAELAFAHLLALDRRIVEQTNDLRAGAWNKKEYAKARGLKGQTLGLVGLGAIGRAMASRALAFEMRILGWSRSLTPAAAAAQGLGFGGNDRASLLAMLASCDAVSLHVAATPETKNLCDAAFFGAMRPGAAFINTSRGSVVDEKALARAVEDRGIRAGLDVYADQPAQPQGAFATPMASLPGATLTHHVGASTNQAQQAVADETVRLVRVFKESGRFENCVNAGDLR